VFEGSFGSHLTKNLRIGTTVGAVLVNTGPGTSEGDERRIEEVFSPAQVRGLADQTNFVKTGVFAEFDYRDNPLGARSGGDYIARFDNFDDTDLNVHNYRRLHLEAKQYFPFFNKRRVIALRARTIMSFTNGSSSVPFYMMDILGGSEDLRGFSNYRFYDANQIIVNAEYRWESFTGLDMAVFFDAGKVAPKPSQINFHDLEASVGVGFRFNIKNATFLRIDTGFSHEGYTVWLKFGNPF
jgi:outer membrane protein assembly factor BamA